jgi:hypothetical protein
MDPVYANYIESINQKKIVYKPGVGFMLNNRVYVSDAFLINCGMNMQNALETLRNVALGVPQGYNYVIAGGYVLGAVTGQINPDSDVDVFINEPDLDMRKSIIPGEITKTTRTIIEYTHNGNKYQIINKKFEDFDIGSDIIGNFDISIVQFMYQDGVISTFSNSLIDALRGEADLYPGSIRASNTQKSRILKYTERGWRIRQNGTPVDEDSEISMRRRWSPY